MMDGMYGHGNSYGAASGAMWIVTILVIIVLVLLIIWLLKKLKE
jgi:uncharacterized membrane protein YtjA (UPF0391 family)